jgi:hypothetical protein
MSNQSKAPPGPPGTGPPKPAAEAGDDLRPLPMAEVEKRLATSPDGLSTQAAAMLIAVCGIFMTPLDWKWAGLVWGYALVWFLVTDRVKLLAYRILDPARPTAKITSSDNPGLMAPPAAPTQNPAGGTTPERPARVPTPPSLRASLEDLS